MARLLAMESGLANPTNQPIFHLLDGEKHLPILRLSSPDGAYNFTFPEEKSLFILGSLEQADFVVKDKDVAKKHLSFTRDLNGIRVIPLLGQEILINRVAVKEPKLLGHLDTMRVGQVELVFYEKPEDLRPIVKPTKEPVPRKAKLLVKIFDRLFAAAFLVVLLGSLVRFFELV